MTASLRDLLGPDHSADTVRRQTRIHHLRWFLTYGTVVMVGLFAAAIAWRLPTQLYLGASVYCLIALLLLWVQYPKVALNVTVFLVLVGDFVTVKWFPFVKNLSSTESIMFVSNSLVVTPLEITICVALALTVFRNIASSGRLLTPAPLTRPLVVFLVFVAWGFVNGIGLGGDLRAAIFEARPLVYLAPLYVLVANTCDERRDYRHLVGTTIVAVVVQSLLSLLYLHRLPPADRETLASLNQHGASITINLVFIVLLGAIAYRSVPRLATASFALASIPLVIVYLVAQRRAAVVALAAGVLYLVVSLFWRQRRTFYKFVPVLSAAGMGYVIAFWNSTSSLAFPAQAIKSVIATDESAAADQNSNLYRQYETFNVWSTIRISPIRGIGFGNPFLRPIPLPDISFFEFWAYVPHNTVLWLWTKLGFLGFVTFLYVIGRALMLGGERLRHAPDGMDAVVQLALSSFIAMYVIFMYVDIAWEARNVTMFAVALAGSTVQLRDDEDSEPPKGRHLAVAPERIPRRRPRARTPQSTGGARPRTGQRASSATTSAMPSA